MQDLSAEFFARATLTVARELIGATLVYGGCEGRIVETEAYTDDAASHAVTRPRQAAIMRETFGHVYVYFIYGMYHCLNFTTEQTGPGAVLIRAVEPTLGIDEMTRRRGVPDVRKLARGPGCLTRAFGIDLRLNGVAIGQTLKLRARQSEPDIMTGPRVGISGARELPWRFYETGSPFVSGAGRTGGRTRNH